MVARLVIHHLLAYHAFRTISPIMGSVVNVMNNVQPAMEVKIIVPLVLMGIFHSSKENACPVKTNFKDAYHVTTQLVQFNLLAKTASLDIF